MKNKKYLTSAINELKKNIEKSDLWVSLFFAILIENEIKQLIEEYTKPTKEEWGAKDKKIKISPDLHPNSDQTDRQEDKN